MVKGLPRRMEAKAAGLKLTTENRAIDDGLSGDN